MVLKYHSYKAEGPFERGHTFILKRPLFTSHTVYAFITWCLATTSVADAVSVRRCILRVRKCRYVLAWLHDFSVLHYTILLSDAHGPSFNTREYWHADRKKAFSAYYTSTHRLFSGCFYEAKYPRMDNIFSSRNYIVPEFLGVSLDSKGSFGGAF